MRDFFLRDGTIIDADRERNADLHWNDGVVRFGGETSRHSDALNLHGKMVFPGFIDPHVHFRTPGYEYKGNMESESISAMRGGVTTACDMPNTNPPTVTIAAFSDKVRRAVEQSCIDMRFYLGMTKPAHLEQFRQFMEARDSASQELRRWMCGVKLYLEHSTGDQKIEENMVGDVFRACADYNVLLMAHCEDVHINARAERAYAGIDHVGMHSLVRPAESEARSIGDSIRRAEYYGTSFHVAHVSTRLGVDLVREAKKRGVPVTAEATAHHLFCTTDDYGALGTRIKMNPPIRPADDRDALWKGIADGTIDMVVTDHAPHTIEEKNNINALKAPSGVPGVETMIPLLLSVAAHHWPHPTSSRPKDANLTYYDIRRLCFDNPNRIFRLGKGDILDAARADVVIVDPNKEWILEAENLHSKCGWTPYEGWTVKGKIERVLR